MPNFKEYYSQIENFYNTLKYSKIESLFAHLQNQNGLQNLTMPQLVNYLNLNRINYAANQFLLLKNLEQAFNQEEVIRIQSEIENIHRHTRRDLAEIRGIEISYQNMVNKIINTLSPSSTAMNFDREFINYFLATDVFNIQNYPTTGRTRDFEKASQATKNYLKKSIPQENITRAQQVLDELEQQTIYSLDFITDIPSIRADEIDDDENSERDSFNSIVEYNNYSNNTNSNANNSPDHTSYMQIDDNNNNNIIGLGGIGSYGIFHKWDIILFASIKLTIF